MSKKKFSSSLEKRLFAIEEKLESGLREMAEWIRAVKLRQARTEMALAGLLFLCGALAKAVIDFWVTGGPATP